MNKLQQLKEEGDKEFEDKFAKEWNYRHVVNAETIKDFIDQERTKAYKAGQQDMLERVREALIKEIK